MNIRIQGGQVLSGEVHPSGSKNSAVVLIPASVLIAGKVTLKNVPDITDVRKLIDILQKMGSQVEWDKQQRVLNLDNTNLSLENLNQHDLGNMRGSSLLWGPMLARFGKVDFADLPGGCTLGARPLDAHYDAFRSLGVKIEESEQGIKMERNEAQAGEIWMSEMSVTATENAVMFAISLPGATKIVGAASEPQVQDVCNFLNKSGAKISGIGSSILLVEGGQSLQGVEHSMLTDHYEVGTFAALIAATGGVGKIHHTNPELMKAIDHEFAKFGINISYQKDVALIDGSSGVKVQNSGKPLVIRAQPWPALPVDMLPLFIPLALKSSSQVMFHNWMYESGLFWTSELQKLGANVVMCDPHRVIIMGGHKLRGAELEAPYIIRAVVAMTMSAMLAEGETTILNADALYRGHPNFSENLRKLGAKIEETS